MKPPRLTWIDYARGIAIILVVYRHNFEGLKESGVPVDHYMFLEYLNIFFFSFRMPLFFIISGIFVAGSLQKRGLPNFVETKMRSILYPYFLWGFLQLTLQMVFSKYTNGKPTLESYVHLLYLPREIGQFWYLYALFNVSILYAFSKQVLRISIRYNMVIGLIAFYLSALIYQNRIETWLINDILHNYIFIALGDGISRVMTDRKNFKWFESRKLLAILIIPFIIAQFYFLWANLDHSNAKYMYVEYFEPFTFLLIAIIGCAFIINLTFVLQKTKILNWLPELGRHSLYIYVSHVMFFAFVRIMLTKILGVTNVPFVLTAGILAGLLCPIILYKLAVKFNMRWIFTLEKEDKKKSTHTFIKPVTSSASLENNR